MGKIIPDMDLEIAERKAIKESLTEGMKEKAVELKYVAGMDELIVREILPKTDMGLTNEYWVTPSLTANAWTAYFPAKQVADKTLVGFYGVKNLSADPKITGIRFFSGKEKTKTLDVTQLEEIYKVGAAEGFFDEPLVYIAKQYITTELYSKAAVTELFMLRGYVVEPAGEVTY